MKTLISLLDKHGRPVRLFGSTKKVSQTPRRFDMGNVIMRRCGSEKVSFFDTFNYGGLFVLCGLAAAAFGAYQAYQGASNALLWVAVGVIVNQAGVCILDANSRVKKILKDADEEADRLSAARQMEDMYQHIDINNERIKNEHERERSDMWNKIVELSDDLYELKEKCSSSCSSKR